jgi:hypothetical protein
VVQVFSRRAEYGARRRSAGAVLARALVFLVAIFAALSLQMGSAMAEVAPPIIVVPPVDQSVPVGATAVFAMAASNVDTYSWEADYQGEWQPAGGLPGVSQANTSTLVIGPVSMDLDGVRFRVMLSRNGADPIWSSIVTLTVSVPPVVAITSQPQDKTVNVGADSTLFSVSTDNATGYQWQVSEDGGDTWLNLYNTLTGFNGTNWGGLDGTNWSPELFGFEIPATMNGYKFRVIVSGPGGPVTSGEATLTVAQPVAITSQPANKSVVANSDALLFSVIADNATGYQWQVSEDGGDTWQDIPGLGNLMGSTDPDLFVTSAFSTMNGYKFHVIVSGPGGSVTSNDVTLTVTPQTVAITSQPGSVSIAAGTGGTLFTVAAENAASYQWQASKDDGDTWDDIVDGVRYNGATADTLSVTSAITEMNGLEFRVVVSGNGGPITSETVTLTVTAAPPNVAITSQPVSKSVDANTTGEVFRVVASNATGYEWQSRCNPADPWEGIIGFTGKTTEALGVTNISAEVDGCQFRVIVSGNGGPVTSETVTLTVTSVTLSISPAPGALPAGRVGRAYSQALTVTGGTAPYHFELGGDQPPGMSLDADTGVLSGTPQVATSFSIRVYVFDDNGILFYFDYTWLVADQSDYDPAEVAHDVDKLARGFVGSRQGLIAATAAVPGLRERRQVNGASGPVMTSVSPSANGVVMGFAASTAQAEAVRQIDGVTSPAYAAPFNIWIDGTIAATIGKDIDDPWGSFAMVSLGADYLVSEKVLLGLSFHYDRMTDPTDADAEITGNGWLAGPYASIELGSGVFWDTQLLYGGSSNDVDMGSWKGSFDSQRWLFDTSIQGQWNLDDATVLTPRLRAVYLSEQVDGYSVENGRGDLVDVDGFTQQQLRVGLGAEIEHRIASPSTMA